MASSFRVASWDPTLIISQIISLQTSFYIVISLLLWIALTLSGTELTIDFLFDATEIRTDTVFGWTLGLVWFANSFLCIPMLVLIVQRAKLILDFVMTLHMIHLTMVWIHQRSFPTTGTWWVLQFVDIAIMTLGGEWACMHYEMKPILMGGQQKQTSAAGAEGGSEEAEAPTWSQTKKGKRKQSDPSARHTGDDEGSLIAVAGKAKKVIIQLTGNDSGTSTRYDKIPLKDLGEGGSQSHSSPR